jgi:hypothetical protein
MKFVAVHRVCLMTKGGRDSNKKCLWKQYPCYITWESIDKAIVSLQIPEVLNDEVIQVLTQKI